MAGGLLVVALLVHAAGALERPPPRGSKNATGLVGPALSRRLPAAHELAGRGGPAAKVPDFCEDTASLLVKDSSGAGCAWYRENPAWCRDSEDFDDQDFTAKLQCCACGGGNRCVDTNADARDSEGNGCDFYDRDWSMCSVIWNRCDRIGRVPGSWYLVDGEYYGSYLDYWEYYYDCREVDDEDFTRTHMCCSCSGGQRGWTDIDICRDFLAVDKNRNGCDWYEALSWCPDDGPFDDEDFSPGSTCCACGGGEPRS